MPLPQHQSYTICLPPPELGVTVAVELELDKESEVVALLPGGVVKPAEAEGPALSSEMTPESAEVLFPEDSPPPAAAKTCGLLNK